MFALHDLLKTDQPNAAIGNFLSRPYQYAFGGKSVQHIELCSGALSMDVRDYENTPAPEYAPRSIKEDFQAGYIMRALLKTVVVFALLIPTIPLALCFKGLSLLFFQRTVQISSDIELVQNMDNQEALKSVLISNAESQNQMLTLTLIDYRAVTAMLGVEPQEGNSGRISLENANYNSLARSYFSLNEMKNTRKVARGDAEELSSLKSPLYAILQSIAAANHSEPVVITLPDDSVPTKEGANVLRQYSTQHNKLPIILKGGYDGLSHNIANKLENVSYYTSEEAARKDINDKNALPISIVTQAEQNG